MFRRLGSHLWLESAKWKWFKTIRPFHIGWRTEHKIAWGSKDEASLCIHFRENHDTGESFQARRQRPLFVSRFIQFVGLSCGIVVWATNIGPWHATHTAIVTQITIDRIHIVYENGSRTRQMDGSFSASHVSFQFDETIDEIDVDEIGFELFWFWIIQGQFGANRLPQYRSQIPVDNIWFGHNVSTLFEIPERSHSSGLQM